jgi:replicative DNA helicase
VREVLPSEECFYIDANQKIYAAMRRLHDNGTPVDLLTITNELRKDDSLELVGGAYHLTKLTEAVISTAHVITHARVIMEKYMMRELIRIGGMAIQQGYDNTTDVFDLIETVDKEMFTITHNLIKKDFQVAGKVVRKVMEQDEEMLAMPVGLVGVPLGNTELDELTGGGKPGKVIVIAARPGVGKTALALNIVYNASVLKGIPTGFFSLEMENDELLRRLVSIDSKVNTYKVDYPKKRTPEEQEKITRSYQRLNAAKIYFDDTPGLNTMELKAKARRMVSKHGVQLIVIDYLQLMSGDDGKSFNREAEIAKISREIKKLAKELRIPIIPLCQLNRDIEKRANNEFRLSDLRESGAIEQDADIIGFAWRPSEEDLKQDHTLKHLGKLDIVKHRGGVKKKILYMADMSTQTWTDYETPAPLFDTPETLQKPNAGFQNRTYNDVTFGKSTAAEEDLPF